jgi:hypothetical protein
MRRLDLATLVLHFSKNLEFINVLLVPPFIYPPTFPLNVLVLFSPSVYLHRPKEA